MKGFARDKIALYGHVADLKEENYRNILITHSLIQLLQEKGLIDMDELRDKVASLDRASTPTLVNRSP